VSPQQELAGELRSHIYVTHANVPAAERRRSRWVMSPEWLNEVRRLDGRAGPWTGLGRDWAAPETILGLPIEVRDDGGVPHLEPA